MKNFKSIAQRNAEFAGMSVMQKRVALAKDVLSQLEMKKFIPTPGTYLNSFGGYEDGDYTKPIVQETCNVCALGALTVSLIDGAAFNDAGQTNVSCYGVLCDAGLWSIREVETIERAFENGHYRNFRGRWASQPDPETRMKEIMLNIVRNEGNFVVSELPFHIE